MYKAAHELTTGDRIMVNGDIHTVTYVERSSEIVRVIWNGPIGGELHDWISTYSRYTGLNTI